MRDWQRVQSVQDLELGRKYLFRPEFMPILYSYLRIMLGITALDVGCGTGWFTRTIASGLEKVGLVVGVDSDKKLLNIAKRRAKEEDSSLIMDFVLGDAYCLPFRDNAFDIATSHTLLGVLKNPAECILEKRRVTKKRGKISAVETIPGLKGYEGNYPKFLGLGRLRHLQGKMQRIWNKKIYPTFNIGSKVSSVQYPFLFLKAGLREIEVNGYLCVFSFSDARYPLEEMKEFLRQEYANEVGKAVKDRENYIKNGLSENDFEEFMLFLEKKHRYLLENPRRIKRVMAVEVRPRIIVLGTK